MGNHRPVDTKHWRKFLKAHGCYQKNGTNHEKWRHKDTEWSMMFRRSDKEIPADHAKNNLKHLGYNLGYLYEWIRTKGKNQKK